MEPVAMEMGAQLKASKVVAMRVGPWGGDGGVEWDDGIHSGVKEIILLYGQCVHSVRFRYDKHGRPILADRHGGSSGNRTVQVSLNYPEEYLTAISGYYSSMPEGGPPVIRSLSFRSNQRRFGPYGMEVGTPFSLPLDGVAVAGFHGRSGRHLHAIGCSLFPVRSLIMFNKMHRRLNRKLASYGSNSLTTSPVLPCLSCD